MLRSSARITCVSFIEALKHFSDPPCQLDFYPLSNDTSYPVSEAVATALADFNGDHNLDIAAVDLNDNVVAILLGYGNGTFRLVGNLSTGDSSIPYAIAIGDFNNDTRPDFVVMNIGSNTVGLFLGNGDGTFQTQLTTSTGSIGYPTTFAVGYIDKDGQLDVAVINGEEQEVAAFLGSGNGSFQEQTASPIGNYSYSFSLVIGDFNNDRRTDMVLADYGSSLVLLYLGFGNGTFQSQIAYNYTFRPYVVDAADFNRDGSLDLAVLEDDYAHIHILFGNGDGTFYPQSILFLGNYAYVNSFILYDLDNDGNKDFIMVGGDLLTLIVFQGNSNGSFQAQKTFSTTAIVDQSGMSAGDLNNDNRPDLAIISFSRDTVYVLLNKC